MKGRWDINYVEKPRCKASIIQVRYLMAIKNLHPEDWKRFMDLIAEVNWRGDTHMDCGKGKRDDALCGVPSGNLTTTNHPELVDCPECLNRMNTVWEIQKGQEAVLQLYTTGVKEEDDADCEEILPGPCKIICEEPIKKR